MTHEALHDATAAAAKGEQSALKSVGAFSGLKHKKPVVSHHFHDHDPAKPPPPSAAAAPDGALSPPAVASGGGGGGSARRVRRGTLSRGRLLPGARDAAKAQV